MIRGSRFRDKVVGLETVRGDLSKQVLRRALGGAQFLESSSLLGATYVGPLEGDSTLMHARPAMVDVIDASGVHVTVPRVIGQGANSRVVKLDVSLPGAATHGYVRKECMLENDADVQSAARSILSSLNKSIAPCISPVIGFFEPEPNTLFFYQEMQPFTLSGVLSCLKEDIMTMYSNVKHDDLRKLPDYGNTLLSVGYLLLEYVTMVRSVNSAGLINRDEKPDNVGVSVADHSGATHRGVMYDTKIIDHAELVAVNGLAARMSPMERMHLNESDALTPRFAPTRQLRVLIGDAPEDALQSRSYDSVTQLGLILADYFCDTSRDAKGDSPYAAITSLIKTREEFLSAPVNLFNPAFGAFMPVIMNAMDEAAVEKGEYTIDQLQREMQTAMVQLAMDVTMGGYITRPFDPELPTKRISTKYSTVRAKDITYTTNRANVLGQTIRASGLEKRI